LSSQNVDNREGSIKRQEQKTNFSPKGAQEVGIVFRTLNQMIK
jgi:hypothetical protein